jgi:AraC-like DNA-binding protein
MNKAMLKEDRIHGNPLYPVSIYQHSCLPGEPLLDLHWHDELEFLTVTKGSAVFRVDVNDFELKPGEAIFVNMGELHSGYSPDPEGCAFNAVVFHPDILGGGQFDLMQEKYIQPLLHKKHGVPVKLTGENDAEREILAMLGSVADLNLNPSPVYELSTKGLLHLIISKLIQLGGPAFREPKLPNDHYKIERLKTVVEYIQANCGRQIRLKELADLVSMSEAYFCRFFKEITTKSPMDYINQFRVQKAAGLLKDSDKKIMEIALDVGFNNLSYFIGVFRHYFGCTPSAYRKRM